MDLTEAEDIKKRWQEHTEELWMEVHDTIWDSDHSQEKEMQKGKMVACGGLTNSCEKKKQKAKEKRRGTPI